MRRKRKGSTHLAGLFPIWLLYYLSFELKSGSEDPDLRKMGLSLNQPSDDPGALLLPVHADQEIKVRHPKNISILALKKSSSSFISSFVF
jgi:hypothetical protein